MRAFTVEQRGFLETMNKLYGKWFHAHQQLLDSLAVEMATLKGIVIQKGLVSEEELENWIKEATVFAQADRAVGKQLQDLESEFNTLSMNLQDHGDQGSDQSGSSLA